MVSAYFLAYGISQLPAGWLADRIGPRLVITIGISGVALCGLLVGLSSSYIMMVICLVLLGAMGGGYHPAAAPMVSASVNKRNQGRALGLHQIGGTASFFLTPLIAVGIATALGWRGSFITLSVPIIVFGIVLYVLIGRRGYTKKKVTENPEISTGIRKDSSRLRYLVPFIVLGIMLQVLIFSTVSFITLFAVDYFFVSEEMAAILLALFHSAGLWAGPLGGYLSDRIGKVSVMLTVCAIAAPFIYLLSQVTFGWTVSVVLIVLGTCQYIGMPVTESYIISHAPSRHRSTVLGIYYFGSRGGPGIMTPVIGYFFDQYGFGASFIIVGMVLLVITIGCSAFLLGRRN